MVYKLLYLYLLFGDAHAFLATQLNYSDPDVISIFCPEETVGETRDHEWITREGIRKSIRNFFLDNPPLGTEDFVVDEDATLTELYHAYYGPASSPTRFIKAVNSIASANVKTDSSAQTRYDPSIQGDGEHLEGLQDALVARYPQILTSILRDEAYSAARALLGTSLHSIQKFYAHSSWLELGNTAILESLGIPGSDIGAVAGPSEDVCTPCVDSQGRCDDNVISGTSLSSGYYNYEDSIGSGFLIPKPETGGKCSHGGILDDSATVQAIGGINKDTNSPCFSPHYYLHEQAAQLAVEATQFYLDNLLQAVGNEKFRRLFDLYLGSALSICIDTTGSMDDDIDAVKDQVAEIVNSTRVEMYILVPFNDPEYGPLLVTDNADEFLDTVNSLYASGGGDGPELFWKGLQLALSRTPDNGNIFCFTDAEAKNGELMEGLIAQAQQQYNKVTVILSDLILSSRNEGDDDCDDNNDYVIENESREIITGVAEYQRLAEATGGLLISTDKFDVADIANIIGGGVESSTVTVENLLEVTGSISKEVLIDNSIMDFEVRISGLVTEAILTDVDGTAYDLTDRAGLEAMPNVEVISHTSTFKAIKWTAPKYGDWSIRTSSPGLYSITVMATSTFDFLGDFAVLDPSPPHPHYRKTVGSPLMKTVYYLELTLIGHLESKVINIKRIEFLDKTGISLRQIDYAGEVNDQIYVRTEPLPETPFYIRLTGHVSSGNRYSRLMPVLIQPVETTVDVWATSQDLSARPGESASALFLVTNFGLESNFSITGTDDMGFLVEVDPASLYLPTNGSLPVIASFTVPLGTPQGTVSTVIITAQSQKQTQSVNSAIAHFVVLPEEQDLVKPMCVITNLQNCTGYNYNGICQTHEWLAEASLQDELSGLYNIYARPEGTSMNVVGLTPGTNGVVLVDYEASCCALKADIIGVDGQGNVGKCSIDLGVLGGLIYDFKVDQIGDTWAILHWNITPSAYAIKHYILTINDDGLKQIPCKDPYCVDFANYLEPCAVQHFNLTPVFNYEASTVEGFSAYTEAITLENEPSAPYNGTEIDATETTITVAWEASICSSHFKVCYFEVGDDPSSATCDTTAEQSYIITGLSKCKAYFADVVAVSPSGLESPTLEFYGVTICPGP